MPLGQAVPVEFEIVAKGYVVSVSHLAVLLPALRETS